MNSFKQTMDVEAGTSLTLLGRCPSLAMRSVLHLIEKGSRARSNLIMGETGVGKELVARALHEKSDRAEGNFVIVNCADLNKELVGSEFFGHEYGAFTGANQQHIGFCEQANQGTLFLDELAELPLEVQPRLLRVLQGQPFRRVGGSAIIKPRFKFVAATNQDLREMVKQRKFREDLFHRVNVFPITVPPLRERTEDILPLAFHFTNLLSRGAVTLSGESQAFVKSQTWTGNVRELENTIERALYMLDKDQVEIQPYHLGFDSTRSDSEASKALEMQNLALKGFAAYLAGNLNAYGGWYEAGDALFKELYCVLSHRYEGEYSDAHIARLLNISVRSVRNFRKRCQV